MSIAYGHTGRQRPLAAQVSEKWASVSDKARIPRHRHPRRHPREDAMRMSRVSATSPFSLPCVYQIDRPADCCGAVLTVCPCVVSFSKFHEPDTHELLRTGRWHPRSILVRRVRHARFSGDMLATSSRGCHDDATRMLRGNCSGGISSYRVAHVDLFRRS